MALNLQDFKAEDYGVLLNATKIDAADGVLLGNTATLQPDSTNRTILIGIGGTGVKTVNYVKGVISKRLDGTSSKYVGFLAVDTDWTELNAAKYLNDQERFCTTKSNINDRYRTKAAYPLAAHRFMPDSEVPGGTYNLGDLSQAGANQKRLVGKAKIHDHPAGSSGVDMELVARLNSLVASKLAPLVPGTPGKYEVYVIGSTCGGTCSGSFTEMPALIREALAGQPLSVYAMLYLPDTLAGLNPADAANLQANGYASLKELNYYQGMEMREGYTESFSYNNPANPTLRLTAHTGYFSIPYLVGSPSGSSRTASAEAREVIAEFLISLLAKNGTVAGANGNTPFLTAAFLANATDKSKWNEVERGVNHGNPNEEADGTYHDAPRSYAAIGFSKATAPQKLVRAYQAREVCARARISPVSADDRASMVAAADPLLPFRGKDDLLNASEGTSVAKEILAPLKNLMAVVHNGRFDLVSVVGEVTFEQIKDNYYSNASTNMMVEKKVEEATASKAMDELKAKISEMFVQYRANVQNYIKKEGPFAFVNLYKGNFLPVGDNFGTGIGAMLYNLLSGKTVDGKIHPWLDPDHAVNALAAAKRAVDETKSGVFGKIGNAFTGKMEDAKNAWLTAFNNHVAAKINAKRRENALGELGYFKDRFVLPAATLTEELEAFGTVLSALGDVYVAHGNKMDSFELFQNSNEGETDVNIAAISAASYRWLKQKADNALAAVAGQTFRDNLVDHFFARDEQTRKPNSQLWLEVPEGLVTRDAAGSPKLLTEDGAIPARKIFDGLVSDAIPAQVSVSVLDLFEELQGTGQDYATTAAQIMQDLAAKSQPRYKGSAPQVVHRYVMYPNALHTAGGNGPAVAAALQSAANNQYPGIGFYASDDADGIILYQQAVSLTLDQLSDLDAWEREYENKINTIGNHLHGKGPRVERMVDPQGNVYYKELMRWADFPAVANKKNPELPDPATGVISREGRIRLQLAELLEEARKLGVVYLDKDVYGQNYIKYVCCDKSVAEWKFDVTACARNEYGLLPMGKELAAAVASQNGKNLNAGEFNSMVKQVALLHAGLLSKAHINEEYAWKYAARVLRAHVPMYLEIKETVEKFREWAKVIIEDSTKVLARLRPAKMLYLMKCRVLYRDDMGVWRLKNENGTESIVANLAPDMLMFSPEAEMMVNNKMLGYFLYKKVDTMLPGDKLDAACRFGQKEMEGYAASMDRDSLMAGKEAADAIVAERDALAAKDAILDPLSQAVTRASYVKAMALLGVSEDEAKKIEVFYRRCAMIVTPAHFN